MSSALFWSELVINADRVVLLAASLSGAVRFRRLHTSQRYLAALVWLTLGLEGIAFVLYQRHLPNLFLIPIDTTGEVWLLSLVYKHALQWPAYARWRPWGVGVFALCASLCMWLLTDPAHFQPALMVAESLLAMGLAGLYFRKLLNELHVRNLANDAMFWVSTGLLLYFLGKLLIGLFSNYLLAHYSEELNVWVWVVHAVLLLVLHSCYLRALWLRPQK